jgi:Rrf2 family protein
MRDRRFGTTLHALLHLAAHGDALTSEQMAHCTGTNPVVVRRLLSHLRDAGLVVAQKGRGGGWLLARPLDAISLKDIYQALELPPLPGVQPAPPPRCLLEQAANERLAQAFGAAEQVFSEHLARTSLQQLATDFHNRRPTRRQR